MSRTTRIEESLHSHDREETTRTEDARWLEERIAAIEPTYKMAYSDALSIPPEKVPHGREYYWGRQSVYGWTDQKRLGELSRRGWTPVPPGKHPELCSMDEIGLLNMEKGYIFNSGLILFERPKYFGDKDRLFIAQHNRQVEASIPCEQELMGVPGMPYQNLDNRNIRSASFAG